MFKHRVWNHRGPRNGAFLSRNDVSTSLDFLLFLSCCSSPLSTEKHHCQTDEMFASYTLSKWQSLTDFGSQLAAVLSPKMSRTASKITASSRFRLPPGM